MPTRSSQDWPNQQVPKRAAGVYTVWEGDRLLYVVAERTGHDGRGSITRTGEADETGMCALDWPAAWRLPGPAAPFKVGTACRMGPVAPDG